MDSEPEWGTRACCTCFVPKSLLLVRDRFSSPHGAHSARFSCCRVSESGAGIFSCAAIAIARASSTSDRPANFRPAGADAADWAGMLVSRTIASEKRIAFNHNESLCARVLDTRALRPARTAFRL